MKALNDFKVYCLYKDLELLNELKQSMHTAQSSVEIVRYALRVVVLVQKMSSVVNRAQNPRLLLPPPS